MKKVILTSIMLIACIASRPYARAQSASVEGQARTPPESLETIVVTAQKRGEDLQHVPIAITSVNSAELSTRGIGNVGDLTAAVPSLSFTETSGHAQPALRGVGTTIVGGGLESPVAFYVDGVYYADTVSILSSFNNIARIDVLEGPQGTLFGRNATGGVIAVTTLDPSETPGANGTISYGNYQTTEAKLYGTAGLAPGVAADIALHYLHQGEGYANNLLTGGTIDRTDHDIGWRSKLVMNPADDTKITVIVDYSDLLTSHGLTYTEVPGQRAGLGATAPVPLGPIAPVGGNPRNVGSPVEPRLSATSGGVSLHLDQDFNAVRLASVSAYRQSRSNALFDPINSPILVQTARIVDPEHQFSQELRFQSNTGSDRLQWVVGGYYFQDQGAFAPFTAALSGPLAAALFPIDALQFVTTLKTRSVAGFGETKIGLTDTTHLTLGARVTNELRTFDGAERGLSGGIPLVNLITPVVDASMRATRPTWRLILDQKIAENALVYASYNRGFKSGGFNSTNPAQQAFKPESLDAYEVGLKSTQMDGRLHFNADGYYYKYTNYQVTSFSNAMAFVENGDAKIYGAEATLDATVVDHLHINSGLVWTHDRFSDYPNGQVNTPLPTGGVAQTTATYNLAGNQLPNIPGITGSIGANYWTEAFNGKLVFDSNYYYNHGWFGTADNNTVYSQKAYGLLAASVAWTEPKGIMTVRLWGQNLTNKLVANEYAPNQFSSLTQYRPPRTYGLEVGFKL